MDDDLRAAEAYISPSERVRDVLFCTRGHRLVMDEVARIWVHESPEEAILGTMNDDKVDALSYAFSRRRLITHGVAVGAVAWVAPTIVAATRADAAGMGSRPPKSPPPRTVTPPAPNPVMGPPLATGIPPSLPFTGNNELAGAEIGASALAAGAALWYLGHKARTL